MAGRNEKSKNTKTCAKCDNSLPLNKFYSADKTLFPDGRLHLCISCCAAIMDTGHEGFLSILRLINKPFLTETFKGDTTHYIRQINSLPQYKSMTYSNSIFSINRSNVIETNEPHEKTSQEIRANTPDDQFLTENKIYSRKWLGQYTPTDIDYLEEYYIGLDRDFRIVTTNHKDYAKKIAKASLHMDKCFQEMQDGVNGADKKYKEAKDIFDTLSKSAKFSESQRGITDVGMGSISQIVEMVESETYVYEHKNDLDKDMYDQLIDDFKHIYKSL